MKHKFLLDRKEATKALNDGFAILCGEKHRAFIEETGEKLIALGMENGRAWAKALERANHRIANYFELVELNLLSTKEGEAFTRDMKLFFSDEEIEHLKSNAGDGMHPNAYNFMKGANAYDDAIAKRIKPKDVKLQSPAPFGYFRGFPLSADPKFASCTLHGEGGLGLDQYNAKSLKYMREEGELSYPIADISRKYHYLGMLLAKQEALLSWAEKIKATMRPSTSFVLRQYLGRLIYELALEPMAADVIHEVQAATGVTEGFVTNEQLEESLARHEKDWVKNAKKPAKRK